MCCVKIWIIKLKVIFIGTAWKVERSHSNERKKSSFQPCGKDKFESLCKRFSCRANFFYYKQLKNINAMWSERHLLLPISQVSKIVLLLGDKDVLIWRVSLEYYPILQAVLLGQWPCAGVQSSPALCKMFLWSWSEAVCPELAVVTAFPFFVLGEQPLHIGSHTKSWSLCL